MKSQSATRSAGIATAVAAGVVAGLGIVVAVVPPGGIPSQYSYPSSAPLYVTNQIVFAVQHLILAWGLLAVLWCGAAGRGRLGAVGAWGSAVTMALLGVLEAIAATAATQPIDGEFASTLDSAYGVVTLPLGVFLVLLGVAVIGARVWGRWARYVVLVAGVWVFIPLTPALVIDFTLARIALVLWMLLFLGIGIALSRSDRLMAGSSAVSEPTRWAEG